MKHKEIDLGWEEGRDSSDSVEIWGGFALWFTFHLLLQEGKERNY